MDISDFATIDAASTVPHPEAVVSVYPASSIVSCMSASSSRISSRNCCIRFTLRVSALATHTACTLDACVANARALLERTGSLVRAVPVLYMPMQQEMQLVLSRVHSSTRNARSWLSSPQIFGSRVALRYAQRRVGCRCRAHHDFSLPQRIQRIVFLRMRLAFAYLIDQERYAYHGVSVGVERRGDPLAVSSAVFKSDAYGESNDSGFNLSDACRERIEVLLIIADGEFDNISPKGENPTAVCVSSGNVDADVQRLRPFFCCHIISLIC